MNLQPLYELKDRLSHAAIAGTQVLTEDFRLSRAVDAIAPMAKASPVFQKIYTQSQSLFTSPEEHRAGLLLDALSLVDAVLYTQGASGCPGDLIPLPVRPGTATRIPYSRLQPLLAALTTSGSGRIELVRNLYQTEPEVFSDFRVLPALIRALEDNNYEIALFAMELLREQGTGIIPMLKEGFDPQGKAGMVRRLELIIRLAGAGENDWYLSILPDCGKNLRESVIYALGRSRQNTELLLTLAQTERGKFQEAALCGLARMETPEAVAFLRERVAKTPRLVLSFGGVWSAVAAELTSKAFRDYLEKLEDRGGRCSGEELTLAGRFMNAFAGQSGPYVREFWSWAAPRMKKLNTLKPEKTAFQYDYSMAVILQKCLLLSILRNPCEDLLRLGEELGKTDPAWFHGAGLLSKILDPTADPARTFETFSIHLKAPGLASRLSAEEENLMAQTLTVLSCVSWHPHANAFRISYGELHPNGNETLGYTLLPGFDSRWAIRLAETCVRMQLPLMDLRIAEKQKDASVEVANVMIGMINPNDPEVCRICGKALYLLVKLTGYIKPYWEAMKLCGWTNWAGLLTHVVQKNSSVNYYLLAELLAQLPMTAPEKANELRQIDQLVRTGRISTMGRVWPEEHIQDLIRGFEAS